MAICSASVNNGLRTTDLSPMQPGGPCRAIGVAQGDNTQQFATDRIGH
jgi:hypothetical protein